jgi:macro domain-containing protein
MERSTNESEYRSALRKFCGDLRQLRVDAGIPVGELLEMRVQPPIGLKRSQIYAVLAGRVTTPPRWEFVRVFVETCTGRAHLRHRPLSVSTDLEYWRKEHEKLTGRHASDGRLEPAPARRAATVLTVQETHLRRVRTGSSRQVGYLTGDIRQVRSADIWVNSENTDMVMPRIQECSVSAIVRYEGAVRDTAGRVVEDTIAKELEAEVGDMRPVRAGEVIVTGAGELRRRNGVQHIIHAAAVHGEPGAGFRAIAQIGRCVENALFAAEELTLDGSLDPAGIRILFPLLGAGEGGGDAPATARTLIHVAVNYLRSAVETRIGTVLFLAYTDIERDACRAALDEVPGLEPAKGPLPGQRRTTPRPMSERRRR